MPDVSLNAGDKAPNFSLEGSDGKIHSLSEFRNRYLVLYFYPKDNTPGCTIEAKGFTSHIREIRELGADVIGISKDQLDSHRHFLEKQHLGILLLSDPESKVIKAYGAYGDRGIFGFGTLRKTFVINPEGKIIKIFDKVKPVGHAEEVINVLKSQKKE